MNYQWLRMKNGMEKRLVLMGIVSIWGVYTIAKSNTNTKRRWNNFIFSKKKNGMMQDHFTYNFIYIPNKLTLFYKNKNQSTHFYDFNLKRAWNIKNSHVAFVVYLV